MALLDEFPFSLDNRLQELDVLDISTVSLDTVDKVLDNPLVDLAAQLEVVHEDVLHRDGFQDLTREQGHTDAVKGRARRESPQHRQRAFNPAKTSFPILPSAWCSC